MSIPEQVKSRITRLIQQGESLEPLDSDQVDHWARASYEALTFSPVQQAKFGEYCCPPWGPTSTRVCLGVWMLKQPLIWENCALGEDVSEERSVSWERLYWLRG